MKDLKNLNFGWLYKPNIEKIGPEEINNSDGYINVDLPHSNINIPFNNFSDSLWQFTSCYKKTIRVLPSFLKKEIYLVCEGIAHVSYFYIDDEFVYKHVGGYDEFRINLSSYLTKLKDYQLTIFVDSREISNVPPFGNVVDYLGYGGIYREIYFDFLDEIHINDIYVKDYDPLNGDSITFQIDVTGGDELIIDIDGNTVEFEIDKLNDYYPYKIENKELWSLDNPKLYEANIKLYQNYHIVDEKNIRFGIRDIKFNEDGFYLNGEKIELKGLNRHQSYPYVGYAMPKRCQEEDAIILKNELGVNIVRTSHYMQSKHFLNKCDELGLLVIEEIPGWQYIGNQEFMELSYQNITSMIMRDKNHPSIIMWGVRINESEDNDSFYKKTNALAHRLDEMRPTFGVRNFHNSNLLEDVYTYNDFIHKGNNQALTEKKKVTDIKNPYLVTETNGHMYPTKMYDQECKRVEHALRHLRVLDAARSMKGLAGVISWCMCDYNTHKDFGSGDMVCYHGVLDMFRNEKYAAYAYMSQQNKTPFMKVLSDLNIGEYDGGIIKKVYVLTNLDYVKVYKNDLLLGLFYPDEKEFRNLEHPPIIVFDFIGNQLVDNEGFSHSESDIIKKAISEISENGENISLGLRLKLLSILKKHKLTVSDGIKLIYKYYSLWGNSSTKITFEGYKNDKLMIKEVKEGITNTHFDVMLSTEELIVKDTYDCVRVVIKKLDQNNNQLPYAFDSLNIECSGGLEVIGPKRINLQGGVIAFWCKTIEGFDFGKISISNEEFQFEREIKICKEN